MDLELLSKLRLMLVRAYTRAHTNASADPFAADYPEHVESSHEFGDAKAVCARFNGGGIFAGQYIAVGREQGRVSIFDFETKESIRFLHGHTRTVSTVW